MIFQKNLAFLIVVITSFSVNAKVNQKEAAEDFEDSQTEMPLFHLMKDIKNGHIKLDLFTIPIIRKDTIAAKIDLEIFLQAEDFTKSLELYKRRREFQDRLYSYFYFLFDFIWEEDNFHPNLDALKSNIKKALDQIDTRKLIKDIYITQILIKTP